MRGGVRFIEYLDPFHYHGTDINGTLIRAGLERELTPELRARVSEENFIVSPDFRCDFNVEGFDYGIALSLFTHLSQNKIRLCLSRLRDKFRGGQFYATVFVSDNRDFSASQEQKGGIVTWHYKDPFHYTVPQLEAMAAETGWEFEWIGNFDHPRNQQMALFY